MSDGKGVAGIYSHFAGFDLRPLLSRLLSKPEATKKGLRGLVGVPSWRKKAVHSAGSLKDSACVRPSEMAPPRSRAKSSGPNGSPCCTPLLSRINKSSQWFITKM